MLYFCCNSRRAEAIRNQSAINGIDFLEVGQSEQTLFVHFLNDLAAVPPGEIVIEGGERITDIAVTGTTIVNDNEGRKRVLIVTVNAPGDYSIYTLRLVTSATDHRPPAGFDLLLSAIEFSFKVDCPNDFDCEEPSTCLPEPLSEPEIDYLAKDYNSFRQLLLDRLSTLMPRWKERNPADLGIALLELLAYVGDYLSYRQDAIATEAYLGTARRRISVRRHARLVDYSMHNGSNARAWIQAQVSADSVKLTPPPNSPPPPSPLPKGTQLLTRVAGQPARLAPDPAQYQQLLVSAPEIFETLQDMDELYVAHNTILFYTWGGQDCCLPKGATRASLRGFLQDANNSPPDGTPMVLHLKKGDVLIFKEARGPKTGAPEDADPTRRHAVRLTNVFGSVDPLGGQFEHSPTNASVDVTEIEWAAEDALPFPFCISGSIQQEGGQSYVEDISVALGNIVLADHGARVTNEPLGTVPFPTLTLAQPASGDHCNDQPAVMLPPRFAPHLQQRPLTYAAPYVPGQPYDDNNPPPSAATTMQWNAAAALPVLSLRSQSDAEQKDWVARADLLGSAADAQEFVAEIENDGTAYLRFGDGTHGQRPQPGAAFTASYRVGNGTSGNVGAETIVHIISANDKIVAVTNPLPARGGIEPESIEDVRQKAPVAFRTQERAVTPRDYAAVAERDPQIERAAATFRWTGSWRTVFLTVDRLGGAAVTASDKQSLTQRLERFRMAGYDLDVDGPRYVSLEIEMTVCVQSDYFRSDVKEALLDVFSNRVLPDGRLGVFHPDNFTFGQPVYLSRLYAAALAVEGVDSVTITLFQRQARPDDGQALRDGKLALDRLEIARLDNAPNFPEHGVFRLTMSGGK